MKKATKQVALGAAVAAGVGYLAGILTAPKSGKETRKDIKDTAVKVKSEAERRLKEVNTELGAKIAEAKVQVKKLRDSAQDELKTAINKAEMAREKAREILSAFHEGESTDKDLEKAVQDVSDAVKHLKKYLKNAG